jgi:hypothetical protein
MLTNFIFHDKLNMIISFILICYFNYITEVIMEILGIIGSFLGIVIICIIFNLIRNAIINAGVKGILSVTHKGTLENAENLSSQMWCFSAKIPKDVFIERVKSNFPETLSTLSVKVKWLCRRDGDTLEFILGPIKPLPDYSSIKHAIGKMIISNDDQGEATAIFVFTDISVAYGICPFAKQMQELVDRFDEIIKTVDMSATVKAVPRPAIRQDMPSVR